MACDSESTMHEAVACDSEDCIYVHHMRIPPYLWFISDTFNVTIRSLQ